MEAEDTIMSPEQITGWLDGNPVSTLVAKQAELSFKAGQDDIMRLTHPYFQAIATDNYKAGIKEVVEWLERCKKIKVPKYQLKEWGIIE
uniref:Uncharacterized protein n=1 Tax=viral metagenome TaxID=1070528 RepID=A0A6M3KRU8_9ZZZZ